MRLAYFALLAAMPLLASCSTANACMAVGASAAAECCKTCTKGKACGDTCISKDYECTKPSGCACNG